MISDLQLSLLGIGAVGVAGVWVYNKWQEREHRKAAERVFRGNQADVLLEGQRTPVEPERIEPQLDLSAADVVPTAAAEPQPVAAAASPVEPPSALVDEMVDCVARIELAEPVPARRVHDALGPLAARLHKPVRWAGFDDAAGEWRLADAGDTASYLRLRAGLQLADREGAVSEEDLSLFCAGVDDLARTIGAAAQLPQLAEVLDHARALDGFCASVDVQIGVHLVHRDGQTLPGTRLRGLAEAAGMGFGEDGLYHRSGQNGTTQYTLGDLGGKPFDGDVKALATHGVTFWLDVPRVADAAYVFDQMLGVARQFAHGLDGVLVDDQRSPLSEAMLTGIRQKIAEIQRRMAEQGVPGGGPRALRLFA